MTEKKIKIDQSVSIRRLPYPYRAMLSVCSDLDETPNKKVYFETARFLNTTETTSMGSGVGLEVGNTIYFDMPNDQFSYWNTDDNGRESVRALMHSGHVDCLHSYGDFATDRAHAEHALNELTRYNCKVQVWIDHAVAPSNVGADIMKGKGDLAEDRVYHADLTCAYGIEYVWRGRVTSVIGQNAPIRYSGIWDVSNRLLSLRTIGKEAVKCVLGGIGSPKYRSHAHNKILWQDRLRNGQSIWEFTRSNPYWGGVDQSATADGLAQVLTRRVLDSLVECNGISILYTHLGKVHSKTEPFSENTRKALSLLAEYAHSHKILVTTTRRLLGFCRALKDVSYMLSRTGDWHTLEIFASVPDSDLAGLAFYVPDPGKTKLMVNGKQITDFCCNGPDSIGPHSISIPFRALTFPLL